MNPRVNIQPREDRVGTETENVFTDDFYENLDGVANALDNVDSSKSHLTPSTKSNSSLSSNFNPGVYLLTSQEITPNSKNIPSQGKQSC